MITSAYLISQYACLTGLAWFEYNFPEGASLDLMYSEYGADKSWFWGVVLCGMPLDLLHWCFSQGILPKPFWLDIDVFGDEESGAAEFVLQTVYCYDHRYVELKGDREKWVKRMIV